MSAETRPPGVLPEWYLRIFQATQHAGGELRHLEHELRGLLEIDGLDTRVGIELATLLTTLQSVIGGLVLVDGAARHAVDAYPRKVA